MQTVTFVGFPDPRLKKTAFRFIPHGDWVAGDSQIMGDDEALLFAAAYNIGRPDDSPLFTLADFEPKLTAAQKKAAAATSTARSDASKEVQQDPADGGTS
jgi:hypothetical protein